MLDLTTHWTGLLSLAIFVGAYGLVIFEETTELRKSKPVLVAAGLIWLTVALPAAAGPPTLTGDEIRSQIVGNTVSGEMGTAFTEYYNPDGTIHGSSADGAYQGKTPISFKPNSERAAGTPGSGSSCPGRPRQ